MARYSQGINGPFRGKAGTVVGCRWREIDYMRSLPKKTLKPVPPQKRLSQDVFKFVNNWLNQIDKLVKIGFDKVHPNRTGRMSAFSYNSLNALAGGYPNKAIDYTKARFSIGDLPQAPEAGLEIIDEHTLLIHWDTRCVGKAEGSDGLMYFVYCPEIEDAETGIGKKQRSDGRLEITLTEEYKSKRIEVQIAFKSLLSDDVSTSQYVGGLIFGPQEDTGLSQPLTESSSFCTPLSVGGSGLFNRIKV